MSVLPSYLALALINWFIFRIVLKEILTQFEVGIIFQFGLNLDSVLYSYIHLVERMSKLLTVLLQLYSVSLIRVFPHYKSALIEFFNVYNLQSYHSFSSAWN